MSQNYPPVPYQQNNTTANLMNPYPYPPPTPLIVAPPNQINQAAKNMETNIIHHQDKLYNKAEKERYKDKIQDLQFKNLENKIDNIARTQTQAGQQQQVVIVNQSPPPQQTVVIASSKLKYSSGMYCLFLCLNIFFPGIGTIVAGIMYGKTADTGNRTGEVVCHGVCQLFLLFFIFGWIWAIMDAVRYFEAGTCC
jgi:hypothetical protein